MAEPMATVPAKMAMEKKRIMGDIPNMTNVSIASFRPFGEAGSRYVPIVAIWTMLTFAGANSAQAAFTICNRSFDIANVSIGIDQAGQIETRGWWKIGPNQCAEVISETLRGATTYVFALDVFGRDLLLGAVDLCVAPNRFVITDADRSCAVRGHLDARFLAVETGDARAWRMFIAPLPD